MKFFLPILFFASLCSGCFSRFVMTERELKEYYRDKKEKPLFFTIQNDSVTLFCATAGDDTLPPLVLVHGAPGAWYGSRNMLEDSVLRRHFHLIAVDRMGYNKSRFGGKRKAVPSIQRQAVAIHEALRLNRSFKKAVLLGSSYGGPIIAKMAILYPEETERIVMLAPSIDPSLEKFWWFHPFIRHGPVRWLLPRFINHATDEKFAHVKELEKLLPEWKQLNVPVTVVQGGNDQIVDPRNLDFARKQLAGKQANFIFMPLAGHLIRWSNPELVRQILLGKDNPSPGQNNPGLSH